MAIWIYRDSARITLSRDFGYNHDVCPFCETRLQYLGPIPLEGPELTIGNVGVCQSCGWWKVTAAEFSNLQVKGSLVRWDQSSVRYGYSELKTLDVKNIDAPLAELRSYLLIKHEELGNVHPSLVESLISDIFRGEGYNVVQTIPSRDGGVDIYLLTRDGRYLSGIQVKRWKNRVGVEVVRSFLGALVVEGLTQGIVVATSGFTKDARALAHRIELDNLMRIELRDAQWIFEALKVTQRQPYSSILDPEAPFSTLLNGYEWGSLPPVQSGGGVVWQEDRYLAKLGERRPKQVWLPG